MELSTKCQVHGNVYDVSKDMVASCYGIERQNIDTKNVAQTAMPDGPTPHRWGATTCGSLAYRGPEILGEIPRYNEAVN